VTDAGMICEQIRDTGRDLRETIREENPTIIAGPDTGETLIGWGLSLVQIVVLALILWRVW